MVNRVNKSAFMTYLSAFCRELRNNLAVFYELNYFDVTRMLSCRLYINVEP